MADATNVWKIKLEFTQGVTGWSEYYWFKKDGSPAEEIAVRAAAIALVRKRQNGLAYGNLTTHSDGAFITKWTASRITPPLRSMNEYVSEVIGGGGSPTPPVGPTVGLLVLSIDQSGFHKTRRIFRGIPKTWDVLDPSGGLRPIDTTPITTWLNDFGQFLAVTQDLNGTNVGYFNIQSRSKNNVDTHKVDVISVSADINTAALTYLVQGIAVFTLGQFVLLRDVRGNCARGLNGVARVLGMETVAGNTRVLTSKHWCCGGQPQVNAGGTMRDLAHEYFRCREQLNTYPQGLSLIRGATRDTGGSNAAPQGKAAIKCCGV